MAKITLFELSSQFNNIADLAMDETMDLTELEKALQGIEGDIQEKCANGIGLIRMLEHQADVFKQEADRITLLRKRIENRIASIKSYYLRNMQDMGKDKIVTRYGNMAVRKNGGKQSMKIDMDLLPAEYKVTHEIVEADTDKIRELLSAGEEIEGATLIPRGVHLSI